MNWYQEWKSISARIHGLIDAGSFFYSTLVHSTSDSQSVMKKILLPGAKKIFDNLHDYLDTYRTTFPPDALESLENFLKQPGIMQFKVLPGHDQEHSSVQFALTSLAEFESEFSYIIADTQAVALRITERAFAHLQRSIVADDEVRLKWERAFSAGEPKCEKLGSTHLLLHGIWAFKANAEGGRTDLILNEPITDISAIEKTSTALVLTEWKIIRHQSELKSKVKEACGQIKSYSSGVLRGIELVNYRYIIVVSEKGVRMPNDDTENEVMFRYINLPVSPDVPSVESKK